MPCNTTAIEKAPESFDDFEVGKLYDITRKIVDAQRNEARSADREAQVISAYAIKLGAEFTGYTIVQIGAVRSSDGQYAISAQSTEPYAQGPQAIGADQIELLVYTIARAQADAQVDEVNRLAAAQAEDDADDSERSLEDES